MPCFNGIELDLPENTVGVDDRSRFRIVDGETTQIEFYPWPCRRPIAAFRCAYEVFKWHIDMIRNFGFAVWNGDRKL